MEVIFVLHKSNRWVGIIQMLQQLFRVCQLVCLRSQSHSSASLVNLSKPQLNLHNGKIWIFSSIMNKVLLCLRRLTPVLSHNTQHSICTNFISNIPFHSKKSLMFWVYPILNFLWTSSHHEHKHFFYLLIQLKKDTEKLWWPFLVCKDSKCFLKDAFHGSRRLIGSWD